MQIVNEASKWFSPEEYVVWHRQIAPIIHAYAPGVPIVTGDITAEKHDPNGVGWWRDVVRAGLRISMPRTHDGDYDILSLHLQKMNKESEMQRITAMIDDLYGGKVRIWITESQYVQGPWLARLRETVERVFPYSWNVRGSECMRHTGPLA